MSYILEQYDDRLKEIWKKGRLKKNRTGIDTFSIHGISQRFDISEYFPVPTRRAYPFKSIVGELLWMLSGSTNINDLETQFNSKIWSPWKSKEFEQRNRFVEGSIGPGYSFQIRDANGQYFGGQKKTYPYIGQIDQLKRIVHLLKTEPHRRDIMWDLYNPAQVDQMRLPPCHFATQLLVYEDKLDCILYQRSADFPLGVPANIIFYSALTYMLAQQCSFQPGELVHHIGDGHIYKNALEGVEEYLSRPKHDCPKLILNKAKDIESYSVSDFVLTPFTSEKKIIFPVAV